jgi:hypothetical protein
MPNDRTTSLLNRIGQLLAEDTDYPLEGTLLYAKVDQAFVAPSIFKDIGDRILYRDPDLDRLGDALLDLWDAKRGGLKSNMSFAATSFARPSPIPRRSIQRRNRSTAATA